MNSKTKHFLSGWFAAGSITSLVQDLYYGKEGYIKLIQKSWVDSSITVPIALALLVIAICLYFSE